MGNPEANQGQTLWCGKEKLEKKPFAITSVCALVLMAIMTIFIVLPDFQVITFERALKCKITSIQMQQTTSSTSSRNGGSSSQTVYRVKMHLSFYLPDESLVTNSVAYDTGPGGSYNSGNEREFVNDHPVGTELPECFYKKSDPQISSLSNIPTFVGIIIALINLLGLFLILKGIHYLTCGAGKDND